MKKSELNTDQILVISRQVNCIQCTEQYNIHMCPKDEGFGHAAVLYEDKFSRTWFYHSLEQSKYLSTSNRINELNKILNLSEQKTNIEKSNPIGTMCPKCNSMKYETPVNGIQNHIHAFNIFSETTE